MIKSALTGCVVLFASLVFGQDSSNSMASNSNVQNQEPVIVEAPLEESTQLALGDNAEATGNYATAIGNGAHADMDNTMVLGGTSEEDRVSVGIGTSNPNSLSSLDLADIDKGLLVNRLSTKQAEMFEMALGIADEGMMIYNTTIHVLQTWDGLKWESVQPKELQLNGNDLQINNGPVVDLSRYQQDLTSANLNGKQLTIEIENGSDVTVDLSPLFQEYEDRLAVIEKLLIEQASANTASKSEPTTTKSETTGRADIPVESEEVVLLEQNKPNPFSNSTRINYVVPEGTSSAYLLVLNTLGKIMVNEELNPIAGSGVKEIQADGMAPGVYYLSLYIDRKKVKTVTMLIR